MSGFTEMARPAYSVCCEGEFHMPGDNLLLLHPKADISFSKPIACEHRSPAWAVGPVHHKGAGEGCWGLELQSPCSRWDTGV